MSAATVVFKNAVLLVGGISLATQCKELNLPYSAEMLDRTAFGVNTRERRGGLFVVSLDAKGMLTLGTGLVEDILFGDVGIHDLAVVVFPDGVTEGSQTARGYAFMGVCEHFELGKVVGGLLEFDTMFNGSGLG